MESLSQQLGNLRLSDDFYVGREIFWKKNLRNKLHLQTAAFILEKGSCVFLFSYYLRQLKRLQKFYLIRLNKFLQSKKYFIRLVGVLVI